MDEASNPGAVPMAGVGYEELRQAIRTEHGMLAVLQSVTAGESATKRVTALLVARFGERLTGDSASQLNAGLAVAELLRECGFREDRRAGPVAAGGDLRWRLPPPVTVPALRRVY